MSTVTPVTDATFDQQVLNAGTPVLVDFWATWCGPCRKLAPIVAELAAEHAGTLRVVSLDTDANPATVRRYGVMSNPSLLLFVDGVETARLVGLKPKRQILRALQPHLGAGAPA